MTSLLKRLLTVRFIKCVFIATIGYSNSVLSDYQEGSKAFYQNDFVKAAIKWREAGDPNSLFGLGVIYWHGLELSESVPTALKVFNESAQQGNVDAQWHLAKVYWEGDKVSVNKAKAIQYYKMAANNGHVHSQLLLGIWYELGESVAKNSREAEHWYRKAVSNGSIDAHWLLGDLYLKGEVPRDILYAEKLLTVAASDGHEQAFFKLGSINGAKNDFLKAYVMLELAARLGNIKGEELKNTTFKSLTESEKLTANSLVNSCVDSEYKKCTVLTYKSYNKQNNQSSDLIFNSSDTYNSIPTYGRDPNDQSYSANQAIIPETGISSVKSSSSPQYNPINGTWDYEQPDSKLKLNPINSSWDYEQPDSKLKLNPINGSWDYEQPDSKLKLNPINGSWDYEQPDSKLKLNPINGSWDYEQPDSKLKLNPINGSWDYEQPDSKLKLNPINGSWDYD